MKILTSFIPSIFTALNGFCGLYAIALSFSHDFIFAGALIFIATVFDLFDGRTARLLKTSHPIGKELDSFADFLSFGIAPALIVFNIAYNTFLVQKISITILIVLVSLYTLCAAIRLAAFNNPEGTWYEKVPKRHKNDFIGIPSTFAGSIIAILVSYLGFYKGFLYSSSFNFIDHPFLLLGILLFIGFLMIAPVPYPKTAARILNFNSGINILFNILLLSLFLIFGRLSFIFMIVFYIFTPLLHFLFKRKSYKVFTN